LEATERMLDELIEHPRRSVDEVLERHRGQPGDLQELETRLEGVLESACEMEGRSMETLERWGMGQLMRHFLGRLDPEVVRGRLSAAVKEEEGTDERSQRSLQRIPGSVPGAAPALRHPCLERSEGRDDPR
jgi:Glu-tRNA(Gln) amidotransferase subunit E-like FAD-binding protein